VPVVFPSILCSILKRGCCDTQHTSCTTVKKDEAILGRIKTGTVSLLHGATRPLVIRTKAIIALPDLGFINVILKDR
jgi:hypothetical protein